ncbi:AAA family ATPase [Acinetobacter baumannii]|nr:AAA family ATPase [Acinetobacter baumannii]
MSFKIHNFLFKNQTIKLSNYQNSNKEHIFTIITGKNGVGKTQLLTSIVADYLKNDINMVKPDFSSPRKIIAVSNIKYDNFPIRKKTSKNYYYIGNRPTITGLYMNDRYHVFKNLICNENSNIKNICEAFNYLGFNTEVQIKFRTISPTSSNNAQISEYANLYEKYSNYFKEDNYTASISNFFERFFDYKFENYKKNNQKYIIEIEDEKNNSNYTSSFNYSNEIKFNLKNLSRSNILFLDLLYKLDGLEGHVKKDDYFRLSSIVHNNKIEILFKNIYYDFRKQDYSPLDSDLLFLLNYNLLRINSVYLNTKDGNKNINFTNLSSGQQSLFNIFLGISGVIDNNSLICIDEPEVNLHPEWQTEFILKLQNIFNHISGCHFLIATHSPQIVAGLKSENGYVLDLESNILHNSIDYYKKSADYQLAKLFNAPGYNNEYIIKICLFLLSKIKEQTNFDKNDLLNLSELKDFQNLLKVDDPVYHLVKEVIFLSEA